MKNFLKFPPPAILVSLTLSNFTQFLRLYVFGEKELLQKVEYLWLVLINALLFTTSLF